MIFPPPAIHVIDTLIQYDNTQENFEGTQQLTPTITATLTCEFGEHANELELLEGGHVSMRLSLDGTEALIQSHYARELQSEETNALNSGEMALEYTLDAEANGTAMGTKLWEFTITGRFPVKFTPKDGSPPSTFEVPLDASLTVPGDSLTQLMSIQV